MTKSIIPLNTLPHFSLFRYRRTLLRRGVKHLVRELLLYLGLAPCPFLRCLMAGASDVIELDEKPMELCPICHKKLFFAFVHDVVQRKGYLLSLFNLCGFRPEYAAAKDEINRLRAAREKHKGMLSDRISDDAASPVRFPSLGHLQGSAPPSPAK